MGIPQGRDVMISETERRGNAFDDAGPRAADGAEGARRQRGRKLPGGSDLDEATNRGYGLAGMNDSISGERFRFPVSSERRSIEPLTESRLAVSSCGKNERAIH